MVIPRATSASLRVHQMRTHLTFGDIEAKLDVLRVECTRCPRKGVYHVAKLIAKHGRRGNMTRWVSDLKGDCPNATYTRCISDAT